jgi:hypothetical protein
MPSGIFLLDQEQPHRAMPRPSERSFLAISGGYLWEALDGLLVVGRPPESREMRFWPCCRPTGSYRETGLEEINGDLLQADFSTA